MAAMAESGRPSKVQVRTCLKCTNRLSDLCYDKHTLCEKCRNQVCGYNSFCDECRSWSTDFRRMYVKHQRTLHQKTAGSRFALDVWEICPQEGLRSRLDSVHTKITQHRETIDFVLSREMTPPAHYYHDLDILHAEYDHLCRALVESREASASRRCGDSLDVASPAAAPPPPRPDPSSHPESRHSPQPGPSSRRDQRLLHRTVLVHETLQAIVPITVASQKIARVSDSPLAIIQATDGDSLQGIPLLISVDVHPVPPLMMPPLRDPHHGLLLPISLLLPEKMGTLMIPPSLPPFGRW